MPQDPYQKVLSFSEKWDLNAKTTELATLARPSVKLKSLNSDGTITTIENGHEVTLVPTKDIKGVKMHVNGNNLKSQVESLMGSVPGGPWTVEGRDNELIIKNRNYHQQPMASYIFADEMGELLSFEASSKTKEVSNDTTSSVSVNPEDKEISITNSHMIKSNEAPELKLPNKVPFYLQREPEPARYTTENKKMPSKFKEKPVEVYKSKKDATDVLRKQTVITEDDVNRYINTQLKPRHEELVQRAKGGEILPLLSTSQLPKLIVQREVWLPKKVNPSDYDSRTNGSSVTFMNDKDGPTVSDGYYSWRRGLGELMSNPNVYVLPGAEKKKSGNVDILQMEVVKVEIDGATILSHANNASIAKVGGVNSLISSYQREVEASVRLIGNPALQCGRTIEILGVGKKYSGIWYITKASHTVDPSGYFTTLDMVRKPQPVSVATSSRTINTKSSYSGIKNMAQERILRDKAGIDYNKIISSEVEKVASERGGKGSYTAVVEEKGSKLNIVVYEAKADGINTEVSRRELKVASQKLKK